jgi:biopolymer transport protein ExbD
MMALSLHGKAGGNLYRPLAEINVTPLVDVMLVLLIIFMVTAPMLATGLNPTFSTGGLSEIKSL